MIAAGRRRSPAERRPGASSGRRAGPPAAAPLARCARRLHGARRPLAGVPSSTTGNRRGEQMERLDTRLDGPILIAPESSATSAASSARPTAAACSPSSGSPRRWFRTTTRARDAGSCAACTSRSGAGPRSSCAAGRGAIFDVLVDSARVADLRPVGGLRADRGEHAHASTARSASPTASVCSATSPTSCTSRATTTPTRPSEVSPTTTPTSRSSGRFRSTS